MNHFSYYGFFMFTLALYLVPASMKGMMKRLTRRLEGGRSMGASFILAGVEIFFTLIVFIGLILSGVGAWHR